MTRGRRFGDTTAAQVDAWVERDQERELERYEAEQDRLDEIESKRADRGTFTDWQRAA